MNMLKSNLLLVALASSWSVAVPVRAQGPVVYAPPLPATKLEMFETNTGRILIKTTALIGSIPVNAASVSVTAKAVTDLSSGHKEYGIVIGLSLDQTPESPDRSTVDYDEVDSLLNAIDVLAKLDWSVTTWTSFDATYYTADRFKLAVFSVKGSGTIVYSVRSSRMNKSWVLTNSQLLELRGLVEQAKRKIDEVRPK